jgi:hypothetical protein
MQLIIKFATIASLFVTAFAAPTTSTENVVNDLDDISDQFIKFINDMNSFNGDFAQGLVRFSSVIMSQYLFAITITTTTQPLS